MPPLDWPRQTPERMVRHTLHDPHNLREFVASALPELVAGLDFTRMRPVPLTFLDDDWRGREADLLFELPYTYAADVGPATLLVCLLLEHQTNTDRLAALRTLVVSAGFWNRCWRSWRQLPAPRPTLVLPPVVPVVLYTGDVTWGSARSLHELVGGPAVLKRWLPPGPEFWSLADRPVDALLAGGAWMQFMAVVRAEGAEAAEFERVFRAAVAHLAALRQADHVRWHELLSIVLGYAMFRREAPQHDRLRELAVQSAPERQEEVRQMGMTIWESALAEGRADGALKSARQALVDVLEERFGQLSEEWKHRVQAVAELELLRAALRRSVTIGRLEELHL